MIVFALLVFTMAIAPHKKVDAKSKCWYGKYWELRPEGKKAVKMKGNNVTIKGKWTYTASRHAGTAKEKKVNKTFKLTKKTKYYIDDTNAEKNPVKKVSKKKFKEYLYMDLIHCSFKVKSGKIVKAVLSLN